MGWKDRLQEASFRGASFYFESVSTKVGRRTVGHTFPFKDVPYTEDMGRAPRGYPLKGYVLGKDYMAARDSLLAACEEAGPGTLVHPTMGSLTVLCESCQMSETTAQGGMAVFDLVFSEAGKSDSPTEAIDYSDQAVAAAGNVTGVAGDVFRRVYSTVGPAWLQAAAKGDITAALTMVKAVAQNMPNVLDQAAVAEFLNGIEAALDAVAELNISDSGQVVDLITDAISGLGDLSGDESALDLTNFGATYLGLDESENGGGLDIINQTTSTRETQAANRESLIALVQSLAVSEGVSAALEADYWSFDQAMAARANLLEHIDGMMLSTGKTGEDEHYAALANLYVDTSKAMKQLAVKLPREKSYQVPTSPTPALVAAYDLYGDLDRADEITKANGIRNPGLLPSGEKLVVLNA